VDANNQRWSDEEFKRERERVLASWRTGSDVDLAEAVAYHRRMPAAKNAARKVAEAKRAGVTQVCSSSGTDTLAAHTELLRFLEKEGQADYVTSYIDSLTRNLKFAEAEKGLRKAEETGRAVLNGFPVVAHGVAGNRKLIEAVGVPVMLWGPTPDVRLVHEIGLAGGHTGYSGGPLISFWNYTDDVPVEDVIRNYQYVSRLFGTYEEQGVPLLYCVSGAMPALSPPSLMIAPEIIEALIAAAQGVRHLQLNAWLQGHLAQDLAYIDVFGRLAREYLDRAGHRAVETNLYSVSPTGRFPTDAAQTYGLISMFAAIGVLGRVTMMGTRTIDEALHIPTKEGTAASLRCCQTLIHMMADQKLDLHGNAAVVEEAAVMEKEVRAMLDAVLELGKGDVVVGTSKAIERGVLDQPYATSRRVKCKVMGVKDATGAARFLDTGDLPFSEEVKRFHKEKIAHREATTGTKVGYNAVVGDMTAMGMGRLLAR
jgi:methylaspartate mutase epsilon subunit